MYPKQSVELDMTFKNVMSVNVPVYHYKTRTESESDIFPYGFAATSGELDGAVAALGGLELTHQPGKLHSGGVDDGIFHVSPLLTVLFLASICRYTPA